MRGSQEGGATVGGVRRVVGKVDGVRKGGVSSCSALPSPASGMGDKDEAPTHTNGEREDPGKVLADEAGHQVLLVEAHTQRREGGGHEARNLVPGK